MSSTAIKAPHCYVHRYVRHKILRELNCEANILTVFTQTRNRDSTSDKGWTFRGSKPDKGKGLSLLHTRPHLTPGLQGLTGQFTAIKRLQRRASHTPHSTAELTVATSLLPLRALSACYREPLTLIGTPPSKHGIAHSAPVRLM